MKKSNFAQALLSIFVLTVTLGTPTLARADDAESEIVLPATLVESSSGADAEANAVRAAEIHSAWLKELAANPSNALNVKAERSQAFTHHPEKMRCWVSGFSAIIGGQTGVCKSAGRKYAFSALTFGASTEIHSGRLKLVSNQPFPDSLSITGERESVSFILGFEAYELTSPKTGTEIKGQGFGVGLGVAAELAWVTLSRVN